MRQVTIVDCEVVDLFEYRLQKSVEAACSHPAKIMHNSGQEPDGQWYRSYSCESCGEEWIEEERMD